jgi:hypothetical protein
MDESVELLTGSIVTSEPESASSRSVRVGDPYLCPVFGNIKQSVGIICKKFGVSSSNDRANMFHSYMHTIVGTVQSHPDPETVGGILADEMGLGKTLTMLTAIIDSLNDGVQFSRQNCRQARANAKGTLVIVPSVRMLRL